MRGAGGVGRAGYPIPKYIKMAGWTWNNSCVEKTVLEVFCNTHRRKKKKSAWRMKLRYKLKLEGVGFVSFSVSVTLTGHLEYCCTMVYLPFLLQYNLLKFSINKNRIPVLQTSGVIGVGPPFVCEFCFNCMSTLDGKRFSEFVLCRPVSVLNIFPQVLLVAFMNVLQQNPSSTLAVSARRRVYKSSH